MLSISNARPAGATAVNSMAMGKARTNIFISYRRADSAAYAGRLYDHVNASFPKQVFLDVETIQPGMDFVQAIRSTLVSCGVMVLLIGKQWLSGGSGGVRIGDENDYVTQEIQAALDLHIPIIPVLVDGASMPSGTDLPPGLASISRCNAIEVRHAAFSRDVEALTNTLIERLGGKLPGALDRMLRTIFFPYAGASNEAFGAYFAAMSIVGAGVGITALMLSLIQWTTNGVSGLAFPLTIDEDMTNLGAVLQCSGAGGVFGFLGRISVRRRKWAAWGLWSSAVVLAIGVLLLGCYLMIVPGSSVANIIK